MILYKRDSDVQFRSPAEIKAYQESRLAETLTYLSEHSPYYQKMFADKGIDISEIRHIEDLSKVPTTDKRELQLHEQEFCCVPEDEIVDYVTTSGTLGEPVTFRLTENDLQRLAYNEHLSFRTAECDRGNRMQLMTTIDRRFMAGLAYFMGARDLGMGVIRVGNGIPELQWDTIMRVKPDVAMMVPSFLIKLMDYAEANGIDYRNCSLKKVICIGEALRNPDLSYNTLGNIIHSRWPELQLHSTYASTEMQSSFTECGQFNGGHIPVDLIIVEFLDEHGNQVGENEAGEVTITTLGVTGMPLLRFRTGDICLHYSEPCACGRNSVRLSPLLGRKGQMIKFKGTTLYPPALYDILDGIPEVVNYLVEVYTNEIGTDDVRIRIGSHETGAEFEKRIKDIFRSKVRVAPSVVFEPIELLNTLRMPQMSRKVVKFIDLRK